jgi:hypothetical protein
MKNKLIMLVLALAVFNISADDTNAPTAALISSEDGILTTSTEIQQVIFVFTPGVSVPSTDIVVHDVMRFGTNILATKNVRVLTRDFPTVVASVPAITNAFEQFKLALPTILTNTP